MLTIYLENENKINNNSKNNWFIGISIDELSKLDDENDNVNNRNNIGKTGIHSINNIKISLSFFKKYKNIKKY